ncbi:hypothetical protein RQP46_009767 [Phenoliferia psychrophenolica]
MSNTTLQPGSGRQVQLPLELIQPIVDQLSMDFEREDQDPDYASDENLKDYPKGFLDLALVSHGFAAAVRLCVYEHLRIWGKDKFLVLTGQLRALPALGGLVRHVNLTSTCLRNGTMDPNNSDDEDDEVYEKVYPITAQAFRWFLEAVPNLVSLDLSGFDGLAALTAQSLVPTLARLEYLKTIEIGHFADHEECCEYLASKSLWLAALLSIPGLKELTVSGVSITLGDSYIHLVAPALRSTITSLSIHNLQEPLEGAAVRRLVGTCPALSELILSGENLHLLGLESILPSLQSRLVTLVLHDMCFSQEPQPPSSTDALPAVLSRCTHLEVLALSDLAISSALLFNIPPSLRHLRLSSPPIISASDVIDWLKSRSPDTNGRLTKLELLGLLYNETQPSRGRSFEHPELPKQVEETLKNECDRLGITLTRGVSFDD